MTRVGDGSIKRLEVDQAYEHVICDNDDDDDMMMMVRRVY